MSHPVLPVITLKKGPWKAEVFDPRGDSSVLGARYVHGGYVRAWWRDDRLLTGRCGKAWDRYDGEGLPETFETSFGWGSASAGDEYLRIGAGRLRRAASDPTERVAHAALAVALDWTITERDTDVVAMEAEDELLVAPRHRIGYRLVRRVRLTDDGLESTTSLTVSQEWWRMQPLVWFAHPFLAHDGVEGTGIGLPAEARVTGACARGPDGLWRPNAHDAVAMVGNVWGSREPLVAHLDERRGGGRVAISLDKPLDHVQIFTTKRICSIEPKLALAAVHGETSEWTLRYRWV